MKNKIKSLKAIIGGTVCVMIVFALALVLNRALAQGSFTPTGSMITAGYGHAAVRLLDGKILVVGGNDGTSYLASAELYDPVSGTFSPTGNMSTVRGQFAAARLSDGHVLVVGGVDNAGDSSSAEIYDPVSGTFSPTGSLSSPRSASSATLLPNGKVLVPGGINSSVRLSSAELFDPVTGTFSPTGSMSGPRAQQTATPLTNGQVLIAGGENSCFYASAELYDPITGTFASTGSMSTSRISHSATLLNNGNVLVAGGISGCFGSATVLGSAEIYDPISGTFSMTGTMNVSRNGPIAALLSTGSVLITGGCVGCSSSNPTLQLTDTAELFDPVAGTFTLTGNMSTPRGAQSANLLPSGSVLVAGGASSLSPFTVTASAELFAAAAPTPTPTPSVGPPTNKDQCKNGGWQTFNTPRKFKNQGDCIQFVNTGK
jgi:hypothetical protein